MHPVLFVVHWPNGISIEIATYRVIYLLAALLTFSFAWLMAKKDGLAPKESFWSLILLTLLFPVGARLWHAATNPDIYLKEPWRLWTLQATGHALFGGVLLASVGGIFIARAFKLNLWRLADAVAPALGVGIAIMRIGCFANGCCFGWPTKAITGVVFPAGSYAHFWQIAHDYIGLFDAPLPVHPAQLYELAGVLLCVSLSLLIRRYNSKLPAGVSFLFFLTSFAVVRAINWQFRVPPDTLSHPEIYEPLYFLTFATCLFLIYLRIVQSKKIRGLNLNNESLEVETYCLDNPFLQ